MITVGSLVGLAASLSVTSPVGVLVGVDPLPVAKNPYQVLVESSHGQGRVADGAKGKGGVSARVLQHHLLSPRVLQEETGHVKHLSTQQEEK